MPKFYHSLPRKSSFLLVLLFLLVLVYPAQARVPNDPQYAWQEKMWNQIGAPQAWDYATGSSDVVVAVIDTGVDVNHPDLKENIWYNPKEISNNGIDDDNNGYIDDVNGWNFIEGNNDAGISAIKPGDDSQAVNHGTILAGLIGAVGNNGLDGVGLNWKIKIMPIRVMNNNGDGILRDITKAVDYAVANGAHIISLGIVGNATDPDLSRSLKNAYKKGVLIVSAAGNNQEEGAGQGDLSKIRRYPVCADTNDTENWILGVTAVDAQDRLSKFANYGGCIDLSAPGENIYSTQRYAPQFGYDKDFYGGWYGSSFAVPLVAGAAALAKSIQPEWGAKELADNLLRSADEIDSLNPNFVGQVGYGRLNIAKAVAAAIASASSSKDNFDRIYYFDKNKIYFYSLAQESSSILAKVNDAKINSLVVADINNDNKPEFIVLIKRNKFDYIQILNSDGLFLNEFSLPVEKIKNDQAEAKAIKLFLNDADDLRLAVERKSLKDNVSRFYEYSLDGKKIRILTMPSPIKWEIYNSSLLAANFSKGKLSLEAVNWTGHRQIAWQLAGVNFIHDLKIGQAWEGDSEQAVLVASRGGRNEQVIVDLNSKSWRRDDFGAVDKKVVWGVIIYPQDRAILRFDAKRGSASIVDGKGSFIKRVELPKSGGGYVVFSGP